MAQPQLPVMAWSLLSATKTERPSWAKNPKSMERSRPILCRSSSLVALAPHVKWETPINGLCFRRQLRGVWSPQLKGRDRGPKARLESLRARRRRLGSSGCRRRPNDSFRHARRGLRTSTFPLPPSFGVDQGDGPGEAGVLVKLAGHRPQAWADGEHPAAGLDGFARRVGNRDLMRGSRSPPPGRNSLTILRPSG